MIQDSHRPHHARIVGQRFPHSHEDHVADPFPLLGEDLIEKKNLLHDAVRGKILLHSVKPAGAKPATDRATHLRTDARRPAGSIRDYHRFRHCPVIPVHQYLPCPIRAHLPLGDPPKPEIQAFAERFALECRKIGNCARIRRQTPINALPKLAAPVFLPPQFPQPQVNLIGAE
jgi:hypothetical protein